MCFVNFHRWAPITFLQLTLSVVVFGSVNKDWEIYTEIPQLDMGSQVLLLALSHFALFFSETPMLPDYIPALSDHPSSPAICQKHNQKSRGDDAIRENRIEFLIFSVSSNVENSASLGSGQLVDEGRRFES